MIGAWALRDWLGPKISSPEHRVLPLQVLVAVAITLLPVPGEEQAGHRDHLGPLPAPAAAPATSALCDMRCNEWQ